MSFLSHIPHPHGRHGLQNVLTGGIANIGRHFGDDTHIGQEINNYSLWSNHNARVREQNQRDEARRAQQTVDQNVGDLNTLFGAYTGNNPALQSASAANANTIHAGYDHYKQAYLDYFNPQIDNQLTAQNHRNTFAGVATGTAGGSADQLRQQQTGEQYVSAQGQLGAKAQQQVNDLASADEQRRLGLVSEIRHGGDATEAINRGFADSSNAIENARSQIPAQALGNLFTDAGSAYSANQQGQGVGYGNGYYDNTDRSLSLFGNSNGRSSSGSISGN